MVILLTGPSHVGKTYLAQRLLEKFHYPYLSLDHLKMGLIRSHMTNLTTEDDDELTSYLWPIVVEIIKTNIENKQNIIIEGCYIPADYQKYFSNDYLNEIKYYCLVFSRLYLDNNYDLIVAFSNIIESRLNEDYLTKEYLEKQHQIYLKANQNCGNNTIIINKDYLQEIQPILKLQ